MNRPAPVPPGPPHQTPCDLEAAFDPPFLGIPAGPTVSARAVDHLGGFVEIFLSVAGGRVVDAGFLTSLPGPGLVAASAWCAAVAGKPLAEAAYASPGRGPAASAGDLARRAARLASRAGAIALRRAVRPPDAPPDPGPG
jgi:hypothetical protein